MVELLFLILGMNKDILLCDICYFLAIEKMILRRFNTVPASKRLGVWVIVFIVLFIFMNIIVNYVFTLSGYPVSFMESQLSFSGEVIKSHFSVMTGDQITLYLYAQFVDFGFIFVYASLIFLVGIYRGRRFSETSWFRTSCYGIAVAGVVAGCCDALENGFILLMIADPIGFPNIFAVIHSYFALVKFILLTASIVGIIVLCIMHMGMRIPQRL